MGFGEKLNKENSVNNHVNLTENHSACLLYSRDVAVAMMQQVQISLQASTLKVRKLGHPLLLLGNYTK